MFSIKLTKGIITRKCEKYNTVEIWPNSINGDSTCFAPNCINNKNITTKDQKLNLLIGLNCIPLDLVKSTIDNVNITNINL